MADIATRLGVSRQLVSIVLREMPGASDETRQRVKKAAEELGYRPHQGARLLRQYRRRQLGVCFAPANVVDSDILEAVYTAAHGVGLQVLLSAQTATRRSRDVVDELLGYRCAGLVLIGPELGLDELYGIARSHQSPMVVVGPGSHNDAFDVIRSAGDSGVAAAVDHLVNLGHSDITYVRCAGLPSVELRHAGYATAMTAAGLSQDVVTIDGPDYTEEAGSAAGRILLERPHLPTAIVTDNDQSAVGVLQVLVRAGVSIPGDVSLTGYDDSRLASLSCIRLTTVLQDPVAMGRAAVDAVLQRITRPTLAPSLAIVPTQLIIRDSTAAPR